MFKKFNALVVMVIVSIVTLAASAGATIYSWFGIYQPEPPKELKK